MMHWRMSNIVAHDRLLVTLTLWAPRLAVFYQVLLRWMRPSRGVCIPEPRTNAFTHRHTTDKSMPRDERKLTRLPSLRQTRYPLFIAAPLISLSQRRPLCLTLPKVSDVANNTRTQKGISQKSLGSPPSPFPCPPPPLKQLSPVSGEAENSRKRSRDEGEPDTGEPPPPPSRGEGGAPADKRVRLLGGVGGELRGSHRPRLSATIARVGLDPRSFHPSK